MSWPLVAAVALVALGAYVVADDAAAQPVVPILSKGPLDQIWLTQDLGCQVHHAEMPGPFQFYNANSIKGDCGTFVSVGFNGNPPMLYSPAHIMASAAGGAQGVPYTTVGTPVFTGTGSVGDPFKVTTVVLAGPLMVQQEDKYVVGDDFYTTTIKVTNPTPVLAEVIVWRAGDCYLSGGDFSYGSYDKSVKWVACTKTPLGQKPADGEHYIRWTDTSGGANFMEDRYGTIWAHMGPTSQKPFADTCTCTTMIDSGAGLSWQFELGFEESNTVSHTTKFSDKAPTDLPPPPPPCGENVDSTCPPPPRPLPPQPPEGRPYEHQFWPPRERHFTFLPVASEHAERGSVLRDSSSKDATMDADGDQTPDGEDLCPGISTPFNGDIDGDGLGDGCDDDRDGDGLVDDMDACPQDPDPACETEATGRDVQGGTDAARGSFMATEAAEAGPGATGVQEAASSSGASLHVPIFLGVGVAVLLLLIVTRRRE